MVETPYITEAEAQTIILDLLTSADQRRVAWNALASADKDVMLKRASQDIDAVSWIGAKQAKRQARAWPRVHTKTKTLIDPTTATAPSLADAPERVRQATALQAAFLARAERGGGLAHVQEAASRGVSSQSGGGQSESYDLSRANSPWARLDLDAQRLMTKYRRRSMSIA